MSGGLRLVFDPALDGGGWPGVAGGRRAVAGEAWVGPLGLLGRLELELGLGALHPSPGERALGLAALLPARDGWWRPSFEADRLGTSHRLLRDRDLLGLWGWRGEPASARLGELWAATEGALPGLPDRLLDVRSVLGRRRVELEAIERLSPAGGLEPAWAGLLDDLAARGVRVTERRLEPPGAGGDLGRARAGRAAGGPGPVGDGSLTLLRAHGPLAAADEVAAALAAHDRTGGVVVVGGDAVLDAALGRHGLPRLGAPAPAPASAALVRLVVEAAFEPMEPADLHALLCLDPGPVPRRVAGPLVGALARLPGRRSKAWRDGLEEGLARLDARARPAVEARLAALLVPAAPRAGTLAASELVRRFQVIATWAHGRAVTTPALEAVARLAAGASALLGRAGAPALSLLALRRLLDELGDAGAQAGPAEAGLAGVARPGAVVGPAETIIWWGFTRDAAPPPPRVRLSGVERAALERLGVTPPDLGRLMEGEAVRWRRPLEMAARTLVLVCPETDEVGERAFPHPLWDELVAALPEPRDAARLEARRLVRPAVARRRAVAPRPLPVPAVAASAGRGLALRAAESPSSLERLLGCSLAWALHHHGGLRPGLSAGPVAPSPLLYGTVAHELLAEVFAAGALAADEAGARAAELVERELGGRCESLALPRYQVERATVKQAIVASARELGSLLARTGATVRGVELAGEGGVLGAQVAGRADLVLSGPDAVLDLKWGRTSNRQKLASGTALQLAVYAELFARDGVHPALAYFILRTQELLGEPGGTLPGAQAPGRATGRDILRGAQRSLDARRAELAAGHLVAPAALGDQVKAALGEALVLAPGCEYCGLGGLCGQGGYL